LANLVQRNYFSDHLHHSCIGLMREGRHRSVRHHSSLPRDGFRLFSFSLQSMLRYYSLKEGAENVILRLADMGHI